MKILIVALALVLPAPVPTVAAEIVAGTASVIDADTIEIHGQRIRLHAVDAIESSQRCTRPNGAEWRCGRDSALALADRIGRAPVACEVRDVDRYGRLVAICRQGDADLNAWLVENGWAVAYRRYGRDYVAHEGRARAAGRGIWASRFEMPWDWRARRR